MKKPLHHSIHVSSSHQQGHSGYPAPSNSHPNFKLALSATWHCLVGCGLGEIAGMVFSNALSLSMSTTIIISVVFGFIGGLGLGIVPLLKDKFTFRNALKIVIVSEGLSIVVMEAFEIGTQVYIPGVMEAGLADSIFWVGMMAGLAVGFIAALPINYVLIKRGVRHHH